MSWDLKDGAQAREILLYPDVQLSQGCTEVEHFDSELTDFVHELEATRRGAPATVGIAAPQIGYMKNVVIVDASKTRKPVDNHGFMVLVNPEIIEYSGWEKGREGCLSVPDYTGNVMRATDLKLKAYDVKGNLIEFSATGFEARVIQHELDHLDGIQFLDRLVSRRTDLFRRKNYK